MMRRIERACAERAEAAAVAERVAGLPGDDGRVTVQAIGYVRLPKFDGMLTLYQRGHLSPQQLRAGWMYRQLFEVDGGSMKVAAMEDARGGGVGNTFLSQAVNVLDKLTVGHVHASVLASAPDGELRVALLDGVARHGFPLRHLTGGGKAWELGLARLARALDVVAVVMVDEGLDNGER